MRTKQNRLAKRHKRVLVLVTVLALVAALASIVYTSRWVIDHTPVTADPADAGARGILLPPLPHRALAPSLTEDPNVAAALGSMAEMQDVDELMLLVVEKFLTQAQIVQLENLHRQILITEPPGNASPAELERYEGNIQGGMDDYGAVEQQVNQDFANMKNYLFDNYLQQLERRRLVWRIDTYLARHRSPMQGCGEFYVQGQERTGICATLPASIGEAESTNGQACFVAYNAFGMLDARGRAGFNSWQEGINACFDFLMENHSEGGTAPPQTIHDASGYCEGNTTNQTVDNAQAEMNGYDASVVH